MPYRALACPRGMVGYSYSTTPLPEEANTMCDHPDRDCTSARCQCPCMNCLMGPEPDDDAEDFDEFGNLILGGRS